MHAGESDGRDTLNVIAAYIALSSTIYYAAAIVLLHILRPDFDPRYRYLSEYVNGPYGSLMTSTFFVLSLGSLALLFGLWRSVSSKFRFAPGMLLWLVWACAVFFAGVYPSDLQGAPATSNGQIHNQMGMIAFLCATLALPLLSVPLRWDKKWQSAWSSAVLLSLPVIFSYFALDRLGEIHLAGLDQRIFLGVTLIWMWILGSKMLAIAKQRQPRPRGRWMKNRG
ncbi:MAG TPA: DUF998 domain-containing protein [Candidatus Eisenbacteria bacterium]|nr:DUF998 domain-containing protein [Candidatus Eisenbacteria bacterium]